MDEKARKYFIREGAVILTRVLGDGGKYNKTTMPEDIELFSPKEFDDKYIFTHDGYEVMVYQKNVKKKLVKRKDEEEKKEARAKDYLNRPKYLANFLPRLVEYKRRYKGFDIERVLYWFLDSAPATMRRNQNGDIKRINRSLRSNRKFERWAECGESQEEIDSWHKGSEQAELQTREEWKALVEQYCGVGAYDNVEAEIEGMINEAIKEFV
jgi:hypothetical protein